jgi:uncharacterized repeat protein (TIGR01451 family)
MQNLSVKRRALAPLALCALTTLGVMFSVTANAANLQPSPEQPTRTGRVSSGSEVAKVRYNENYYIVELNDPTVASYHGGIAGMAATSNQVTGATKLDTNSTASTAYAKYLTDNQAEFIADCEASFGHTLNVSHRYQHVFNGLALELTAKEAKILAGLSSVKSISRERIETPSTDVGPQLIKADDIWGPGGQGPHSMGEDIVVAILDTGINHDHPSFADIGADGYDHTNPLGAGSYLPGSYCDLVDPTFCNDKLIGAWSFVAEAITPGDSDGHGSHTASTAAGNVIPGATLFAPTTSLTRDLSGVAPHANIISYDVCTEGCPAGALLAAINQVVIDAAALPNGIHSLNFSISGGESPYTDAIEIGFLNATAAGVYVAASAGNSGPGASTVAHLGPWVSTTAASTHNRALKNSVVSMNSDNGPLADIIGAGFTDSYGPADIINSADLEVAHPGSTECGLGSIGDFISPWPAGFFSGEIVACTRGTFGRVEKGANVLAAGAGGFILMDTGGGVVGDSHVLPGVHISQANSAVLTAWLAGNENTIGTINGVFVDLEDANADIMAGFSSRGPNLAFDVIKPDISAPGVSIMAAAADPDDYQFLSGTSMSSPHNAGAGALISAIRPDWTPYEIQSALMMTSSTEMLKEDGLTPADPFDRGAGRINLKKARDAALVLDETPANFFASDPAAGGDPKTLNIASMQNSNCVGDCSWTRTVKNVSGQQLTVNLEATGPVGLGLSTSSNLNLDPGESGNVTVSVDTRRATAGWNFAELELQTNNGSPTLHMPIAVVASAASNSDTLTKTVDAAEAVVGEVLSYEININNIGLTGLIDMTDVLPTGLNLVPGSESSVITNGSTLSAFAAAGGELNWQGELDQGGLTVGPGSAPFGYFPLSTFFSPLGCPGNCDDGAFGFNVPAYVFNGQTYTSVIMSVNGTLEAGTASGLASSFNNQNLPDATAPNNILAPFWTDLNMDPDPASGGGAGGGGNWYMGVLNAGPDQFTIYEWENVPLWGDLSNRYTFQIWVQNGTSGNIWYTYGQLGTTFLAATVGVENDTGTGGDSYFYNATGTDPDVGQDLQVLATTGGTATFNFQAQVDYCAEDAIVNRADLTTLDDPEFAIAVTECMSNGAGTEFIFDGRAVAGCPLDAIQKTYACVADATSPTDTITIAAGYKVNQVDGHMYAATITLAANSELVIVGNNKSLFVTSTVALGAGAKMDGNIYAGTTVALGADAEMDGDIYAGTTLALDAGASTTGSLNARTTVALGAHALVTGDVTGGTTVVLAANSNVTGNVTSINSYVDLGAGARVEGFTTSETGATTLGAGASTCQTVTAVTATLGAGASVRGNLHAVTTTLGANGIVTGNLGGTTGVTTTMGANACFGTMSSGMTTTLGAGAGVCTPLQSTTAGDRCL